MIGPFPESERRRESDLLEELRAIAGSLVREWRGASTEGDFGGALLHVAARLAGHVSSNLADTPKRDAFEFFRFLDVPGGSPTAAVVPVVLQLTERRETPLYAPARVQAAAAGEEGDLIFETTRALWLTPARLGIVAAVDGDTDRIEEMPPGFTELAAPVPTPPLRFESLPDVEANRIQVSPADVLVAGDVVWIEGAAYRIKEGSGTLYELEDELPYELAKITDPSQLKIERVTRFDAFQLRDVQGHHLYVGDSELLNLEGKATIRIRVQPEGAATTLLDKVVWSLYGTEGEDEDPKWHQLDAAPGKESGEIELRKTWEGTADPLEVGEVESRWVRATYTEPIVSSVVEGARLSSVRIQVETAQAEKGNGTGDPSESIDASATAARTISQVFHNSNPLPLASRFLPFGPEPQRFDAFSVAAPEAFSKKDAIARLHVDLADSTIVSMSPTT